MAHTNVTKTQAACYMDDIPIEWIESPFTDEERRVTKPIFDRIFKNRLGFYKHFGWFDDNVVSVAIRLGNEEDHEALKVIIKHAPEKLFYDPFEIDKINNSCLKSLDPTYHPVMEVLPGDEVLMNCYKRLGFSKRPNKLEVDSVELDMIKNRIATHGRDALTHFLSISIMSDGTLR